jgi:hypothetical protein
MSKKNNKALAFVTTTIKTGMKAGVVTTAMTCTTSVVICPPTAKLCAPTAKHCGPVTTYMTCPR